MVVGSITSQRMSTVGSSKKGSMNAVAASGIRIMSDSLMPFHPAMEEPSNILPSRNRSSSTSRAGIVTCCSLPRVSVKRRSANFTCFSLMSLRTSFGVISPPGKGCISPRRCPQLFWQLDLRPDGKCLGHCRAHASSSCTANQAVRPLWIASLHHVGALPLHYCTTQVRPSAQFAVERPFLCPPGCSCALLVRPPCRHCAHRILARSLGSECPSHENRPRPANLSGAHVRPAALLVAAGVRDSRALRHGGGRRHFSHRHVPACGGAGALASSLRSALPPSDRRTLREEPFSPAALLSISGGDQTLAPAHPRSLSRKPRSARARSPRARCAIRRGQLGVTDARGLGTRLGGVAVRHGDHAVHIFPAGRRSRLPPGDGRDHLWARAPRDVSAGRREHLRHPLGRRRRRSNHLRRHLPAERGRAVGLQLRAGGRRDAAEAFRGPRARLPEAA